MKGSASVMKNVVIIGCGLAGLGAAWRLEKEGVDPIIFEMESRPGGLYDRGKGFFFDYTVIFFTATISSRSRFSPTVRNSTKETEGMDLFQNVYQVSFSGKSLRASVDGGRVHMSK